MTPSLTPSAQESALPDIAEPFLRDPAFLQLGKDDWEFDDDFAVKCAWGAHGYDTGMVPFYSAATLKEAMQAAWNAARATPPIQQGVVEAWQDIATAPKDGTPFLAWYPKVRLDDDDNLTDEVVGGAWAIVSVKGNEWDEPEWLNAQGAYYFDDCSFAEMPTHWQPLPASPSLRATSGENGNG